MLVLGANIAMLFAFCQRSSCISRRLWRDSILWPCNHLLASSMSCGVLQHSFASSRNNEVRQGSIPTNVQSLKSHSRLGWPSPFSTELSWYYDGPLHPTCRCTEAHVLLQGPHMHEEFLSSSSANFGNQFWALCLDSTLHQGCRRPGSRSRLWCRCAG